MADASIAQNLLSGALGALGASILNYFIQINLSQKTKKEEETSMAYVHLTKVTSLVATIEICKILFFTLMKVKIEEKLDEIRKQTGKDIHIAEFIVAALYVVNHEKRESFDSPSTLAQKLAPLREMLREFLDFSLSPEQLSKLPKDTVISYQLFAGLSSGLKRALEYFLDIAAGKITAVDENAVLKNDFLDTLYMIKQLHEQALDLRNQLRVYGQIDKNEADRMLKSLKGIFARTYLNKQKAKENLDIAITYMENLYAQKNGEKESETSPVN